MEKLLLLFLFLAIFLPLSLNCPYFKHFFGTLLHNINLNKKKNKKLSNMWKSS